LPLGGALILLPLVGLALNGTSSALYGTVPEFASPGRQSRIFGLFYTLSIGASAVAPVLCGLLSDLAGVPVTLAAVAIAALAPIPLCPLLARSIKSA
jgi:MFS-type transporter involved in bile tolerance (Atg22 family)